MGHLKALALQVLKRSVPVSHALESGAVGHPTASTVQGRHLYDAQDSWEWITERAAILEFESGFNRDEANHRAFMLWYRRFVEGSGRQ
jgi:hypothetical protein